MQHLDEGTIHSWLDGALSADEATRVDAHVAECPQCASAVAEARGFIAASSRILTALDNAPRRVIPVAAPVKRVNPIVWRVAATVLVVAAGTLVVVQNRDGTELLKAVSENQATTLSPQMEGAMERSTDAATSVTADGALSNATASQPPRSTASGSKAPAVVLSEKAGTGNARRGRAMSDGKTVAGGVLSGQAAGVASDYAAVPTPAPPTAAASRVEAAALMDAAIEPERLKVVSTPRQIGAKVTLYEVAPGDTVTLTESTPAVLRGATSMAPQAVGKTTAMAPKERTDVVTTVTPESRRTGEVAPTAPPVTVRAPPVTVRAPAAQVGAAIALRTITWNDPATGSRLTLSGRMPDARLQEIRIRIERERAAAAAAAKKNP